MTKKRCKSCMILVLSACFALVTLIGMGALAAKKEIVIRWDPWAVAAYSPLPENLERDFEAAYPNIDLQTTAVGWSNLREKYLTAIAGGNPPDVILFYPPITGWAEVGALTRLDEYVANDPDVDPKDWTEGAWEQMTYDGHVYGLPASGDSVVFYWNKDHFKQAGLDPERAPKTWAETDEYAEKLTVKDPKGGYKVIGLIPWLEGQIAPQIWSNRGRFYDPTTKKITAADPKNVEVLARFVSYAQKYGIDKIQEFVTSGESAAAAAGFGNASQTLLGNGFLSMSMDCNYVWHSIDKYFPDVNYGMALAPIPEGGVYASWSSTCWYAIPKGAEHPDAAWKYLKFFATVWGREWALGMGDLPVRIEWLDDPELATTWQRKVGLEAAKYSKAWPSIPVIAEYLTEIGNAVDQAVWGKKTPEKALEDVEVKIQKALDKALSRG